MSENFQKIVGRGPEVRMFIFDEQNGKKEHRLCGL
jgi:hypothetical protein